MKATLLLFVWIITVSSVWVPNANALWSPDWEVIFSDSFDAGGKIHKDAYHIGAGGNGTDGYGITEDILKTYIPGWPDQAWWYVQNAFSVTMESTVDGAVLGKDARAIVTSIKNWNIDKKSNSSSISGTETISWQLVNVPSSIDLTLIDYGNDAGRITAVAATDMKTQSNYVMSGITTSSFVYRYMQVRATYNVAPPDIFEVATDQNGYVTIKWHNSISGKLYAIYYSDDLQQGWQPVPGQQARPGTGGDDQWTDDGSEISPSITTVGKRFYRVEVYE